MPEKDLVSLIEELCDTALMFDREKCIKAGCDDFATKRIDRQNLIAMVREHSMRDSSAATCGA